MKKLKCRECSNRERESDLIYLSEDGLWCVLDDDERKLIAAASEMLDMLKALVEIEDIDHRLRRDTCEVKALIAKAGG